MRATRVFDELCHKRSYDLTGNESGVCPEYGTPAYEQDYPLVWPFDRVKPMLCWVILLVLALFLAWLASG